LVLGYGTRQPWGRLPFPSLKPLVSMAGIIRLTLALRVEN
jgi:hypothetical protein